MILKGQHKEAYLMDNRLIGKRLDEILCHEVTIDGNHLTTGMGEAHMLLANGGIKIKGQTIHDMNYVLSEQDYSGGIVNLKVGRKKVFLINCFGDIM